MSQSVLVVDDDRSTLLMVEHALRNLPVRILKASGADDGLRYARDEHPDVILLDVRMPRMSGLEVLRHLKEFRTRTPVILMTAGEQSQAAIEAMQLGAFDFIAKPLDVQQLCVIVQRALDLQRHSEAPLAIAVEDVERNGSPQELFIGRSTKMLEVFKEIGRTAGQNVTVLIRGESGTGKELVARSIYRFSERAERPFMAVNCAALTDTLLESELFGHEKGAFTGAERRHIGKFEQASGGTLFLDEVGDMSPLTQGKVLRVLQEQRFERVGGNVTIETDVRLIAATNRPLEEMVENGSFRSDLYYRLNIVTIDLPPLRERVDDIPMLLQNFLTRFRKELNKPNIEGISPETLRILQRYPWPGNVRELQSVVRQFVLKARSQVIVPDDLPIHLQETALHCAETAVPSAQKTQAVAKLPQPDPASIFDSPDDNPLSIHDTTVERSANERTSHMPSVDLKQFIEERMAAGTENLNAECQEVMERYLYARVYEACGGNQSQAAKILGVTRGKVRDRLATFHIVLGKSISIPAEYLE